MILYKNDLELKFIIILMLNQISLCVSISKVVFATFDCGFSGIFKSDWLIWPTIPAPSASPSTLTTVRTRSLKCWLHFCLECPLNSGEDMHHSITYNIQSTAKIKETSSGGKPTVSSTITNVTRPACGIPAAPMLAAVDVIL